MTKGEVLEKYGMKMLRPDLNEEDSDGEFENFVKGLRDFSKKVDENIKNYCVRCKYYKTNDSDKCDSWIHGASYGVDCKYIGKAKGEDMSKYEGRRNYKKLRKQHDKKVLEMFKDVTPEEEIPF